MMTLYARTRCILNDRHASKLVSSLERTKEYVNLGDAQKEPRPVTPASLSFKLYRRKRDVRLAWSTSGTRVTGSKAERREWEEGNNVIRSSIRVRGTLVRWRSRRSMNLPRGTWNYGAWNRKAFLFFFFLFFFCENARQWKIEGIHRNDANPIFV